MHRISKIRYEIHPFSKTDFEIFVVGYAVPKKAAYFVDKLEAANASKKREVDTL